MNLDDLILVRVAGDPVSSPIASREMDDPHGDSSWPADAGDPSKVATGR